MMKSVLCYLNTFQCKNLSNLNVKRFFSKVQIQGNSLINVCGKDYSRDDYTNITPKIINKIDKGLHLNKYHPLGILMIRIKDYFNQNYRKHTASPMFSFHENLHPIVTVQENFDELLVPLNHYSRSPKDSYFINSTTMLRAHTSAHEAALIRSGLDQFVVVGDVFRRDEIDKTHYPVFHQMEGVRLYSRHEIFGESPPQPDQFLIETPSLRLTPKNRFPHKQNRHGDETAQFLEMELKTMLEKLARHLLGSIPVTNESVPFNLRWVPAYFPWTHPSFELELEVAPGTWLEILGCGVIEQDMLDNCGAGHKVGFAFGLGLERWAMRLFGINDIRVFWSSDEGFLHQFQTEDPYKPIVFKPFSAFPPIVYDVAFWLPSTDQFDDNDFYDAIRSAAGDIVERTELIDKYYCNKRQQSSRCYRIVYRHMSQNLTHKEISQVHGNVTVALQQLGCEIR